MKLYLNSKDMKINYPVYHILAYNYKFAKQFAEINNLPNTIWKYVKDKDDLLGVEGWIIAIDWWYNNDSYDNEFRDILTNLVNSGKLYEIIEKEYDKYLLNE